MQHGVQWGFKADYQVRSSSEIDGFDHRSEDWNNEHVAQLHLHTNMNIAGIT